MSAEEFECPECEPGAPTWVTTFADLMSLLMCFFVLLLSFSEIEASKFKQMAGSMRFAFGVQREIEAVAPPMGTSIIAQEFSPGKPEQTITDDIRQITVDELPVPESGRADDIMEELEAKAEELREALDEAIDSDLVEVETEDEVVIIRIKERGSFPSGEANLQSNFIPILAEIREHLSRMPGKIEVAGHTDNIPISTFRFRSNWELSSARAVSVLHQLLKGEGLPAERLEVKGMADKSPLVPNDTAQNRAKNRRVEIVVRPVVDTQQESAPSESEGAPPS